MASLNDFDGVDSQGFSLEDQIQQRGGQAGVFNEPAPFVIPNSNNTANTREAYEIDLPVTGALNSYNASNDFTDPGGAQAVAALNQNQFAPPFSPNGSSDAQSEILDTATGEKQPYVVNVYGYAKPQQPLVNPLHDYDSYTYNLSLHVMTTEEFNNISDDPDGYTPDNVLVAGAGKYSDNFRRNIHFQEDFYFEDLRMRSIINTTKLNKMSNVVELEFTIIEPNGFTFIQRLMNAVESSVSEGGLGSKNYLKQPYILQLDFYGSRDGEVGAGLIPNQTKLIPIRLVGMQTRISTKGTEYRFQATPYNHTAFDPKNIVLPAQFTVKASKVVDVFGRVEIDKGIVDQETERYQSEQDELARRKTEVDNFNKAAEFGYGAGIRYPDLPKTTTVLGTYGIAEGYNSWYRTLARKSNGSYKPNFIKFILDPEIGNSLIYKTGGPNDVSNAGSRDDSTTNVQESAGLNKGQIQWDSGTITMPAGTSIQAVVKWAIANSDYMRLQLLGREFGPNSATRDTQLKEPLKFVKIIPRIKILEYDLARQDYQYEITYYIRKYFMNSRSPNAPQGRAAGWVKEYNYIYTGGQSQNTNENLSNKDVINLELDFNMLFFTTISAFRQSQKLTNTGKLLGEEEVVLAREGSGFEGDPDNASPIIPGQESNPEPIIYTGESAQDRIGRASNHYVSGTQDSVRTGAQNNAAQAAADIINNTQLDARGDMINIRMTIIGDPQFIKQDDVFYNLGILQKTGLLTPNGSLFMDEGELYVFVNFRSPIDYDESTGLAVPFYNRYSYSEFSGVYKVITVDNIFRNGKFTQDLNLVRLAIDDSKRVLAIQQGFRRQNALEVGLGQNVRFPTTGALGQRIAGTVFSGGLLAGGAQQLVNSLAGQVFNEIQSEVADIVEDLGTDLIEGIGDVVTDIGESLGLIDSIDFNQVIDFELGDASVLAGVPEVDWTGFGDVVGW